MSRSLRERGAHAVPRPRMQAARATLLAESDKQPPEMDSPFADGVPNCHIWARAPVLPALERPLSVADYEIRCCRPGFDFCSVVFPLVVPPLVRNLHWNHLNGVLPTGQVSGDTLPRPSLCNGRAWIHNAQWHSSLYNPRKEWIETIFVTLEG